MVSAGGVEKGDAMCEVFSLSAFYITTSCWGEQWRACC